MVGLGVLATAGGRSAWGLVGDRAGTASAAPSGDDAAGGADAGAAPAATGRSDALVNDGETSTVCGGASGAKTSELGWTACAVLDARAVDRSERTPTSAIAHATAKAATPAATHRPGLAPAAFTIEYPGVMTSESPATQRRSFFFGVNFAFPGGFATAGLDVGCPPGFVLVLKMLDAIGLRGHWPVVALSIGGTVVVPVAALVAVWAVAGSDWVRRCAPLLVVAPYALWMVTSADAVYTAVGSCGVAACTLGLRATPRAALAWGALGGLLLGGLLMLTYGGAVFVLVPLVACLVAFRRRDSGARAAAAVMVAAIVAGGAVTALFWAYGFWWFAGAAETQRQYWAGTARLRPFAYFMLANLAASLIAVGPATFAGMIKMCELRRTPNRVAVLVVGGAVALMAAHVSQYSRAEVERIWLLFFPWLALSGGMLVSRTNRRLAMMAVGAQVTGAVVLQAALVSKW